MCQIQLDSVSWRYEIVPGLLKLQSAEFNQGLHKILLFENPEQYSLHDQWPPEPERTTLLRLVSETLLRIILIASTMCIANCPVVQANKFDIIDFLFSMSEYHHSKNINLPVDYEPPKLAIIFSNQLSHALQHDVCLVDLFILNLASLRLKS
uniref:Uncharacterized protein n=1 Tax=Glossina pallidipes TaxID=7398 RepID=A0A1B0AFK9_GLOPL